MASSDDQSHSNPVSRRPLSPHLQVYKPQITSVMSILHRMAGIILTGGAVLLVIWLACLASGPGPYAVAQSMANSILGQVIVFGWVFAFFYHMFNGLRYMLWDTGHGFNLRTVSFSAYLVVGASFVSTLCLMLVAYLC